MAEYAEAYQLEKAVEVNLLPPVTIGRPHALVVQFTVCQQFGFLGSEDLQLQFHCYICE